jgi:hypothetical protein
VQRCRGAVRGAVRDAVVRGAVVRGVVSEVQLSEVQLLEVQSEVQRCRGAEVQRCRGSEVQRCRGAEVQRVRDAEVQGYWCRGAEVGAAGSGVRCRGGAEVLLLSRCSGWCRDVVVQRWVQRL